MIDNTIVIISSFLFCIIGIIWYHIYWRLNKSSEIDNLTDYYTQSKNTYNSEIKWLKEKIELLQNVNIDSIKTYINIFEFDVVSIERDTRNKNQTIICYWKDDNRDKIKHFYLQISVELHNELVELYSSKIDGIVLQDKPKEISDGL